MTTTPAANGVPRTRRQQSRSSRALGYTVAAAVNSVLLYLVNVLPGWQAVPFLDSNAAQVVPLLNAVLIIGVVGNLINVLLDERWMRALTEALSSIVSLFGIAITLTLFPFAFDDSVIRWSLITRTALAFAAAACVISIIVQIVVLRTRPRHRSNQTTA